MIDSDTREFLGHLIAVDGLGEGYVVPGDAMLQDIGHQMGVVVTMGEEVPLDACEKREILDVSVTKTEPLSPSLPHSIMSAASSLLRYEARSGKKSKDLDDRFETNRPIRIDDSHVTKAAAHQPQVPEKCPISTCHHHVDAFMNKDSREHMLTHFRNTLSCDFCSSRIPTIERTFNQVEAFKTHLITAHGVERTPSRERERSTNFSMCSTCSALFNNAQCFYNHLDDCVLKWLTENSESMALSAKRQVQENTSSALRPNSEEMLQPNAEETKNLGQDDSMSSMHKDFGMGGGSSAFLTGATSPSRADASPTVDLLRHLSPSIVDRNVVAWVYLHVTQQNGFSVSDQLDLADDFILQATQLAVEQHRNTGIDFSNLSAKALADGICSTARLLRAVDGAFKTSRSTQQTSQPHTVQSLDPRKDDSATEHQFPMTSSSTVSDASESSHEWDDSVAPSLSSSTDLSFSNISLLGDEVGCAHLRISNGRVIAVTPPQ